MRTNTDAYLNYKEEIKDIWNFAVMVSYAVPALSKTIKGTEMNIENYALPRPDHFKNDKSSIETLKKWIKPSYKSRLATYLWISSFSFFEAYVNQSIAELIDFHGGAISMRSRARDRANGQMIHRVEDTASERAKLHGPFKPSRTSRYSKYIAQLKEKKYRFPSELFSHLGIINLSRALADLKATDIPGLMQDAFFFELTESEMRSFTSYRDKRNSIAHGRPGDHSITEVLDMNEALKGIASRFDRHLIDHYFVLESDKPIPNGK